VSKRVVDARNLLCPLPVIRTQDAIASCQPGDELQVLSTDPGVVHDIPAWCRVHGHTVCNIARHEREIIIDILVEPVEAP
jgi:tRNA 2-thiouridine synthesizing protein A